jgi:tRNA (guanine37-N1)-methyltransferase
MTEPSPSAMPTLRLDIITLMPQWFAPLTELGVGRRAFGSGMVQLKLWNPRDHADGGYRRVDDRPFGGGPGMVLMAEPLARTLDAIWADRGLGGASDVQAAHAARPAVPVILFSPVGRPLGHARVAAMAQAAGQGGLGAVLVCGRYEGLDQRWIDACVTEQISLGDFVLSGGEIAALAFVDAVVRLLPGVLGDAQSPVQDSFHPAHGGGLDCPHYTRPEVWRGQGVPEVLLSGNHALIEQWRTQQRLQLTARHRPDLLAPSQAESSGQFGKL